MKDSLLLTALEGDIIFITQDSKHAYPWLWRETYLYLPKQLSTQTSLKR